MGLEEILKQVEETGKEKAADIRKATVEEVESKMEEASKESKDCLLYTSPSPRDKRQSRMPSSA